MPDPQPMPRQSSIETKNRVLAARLSEAINVGIEAQGQVIELETEVAMLSGMVGQMAAENRVLRRRLGLGENDAIELTPEEEQIAAGGQVEERDVPDDHEHVEGAPEHEHVDGSDNA